MKKIIIAVVALVACQIFTMWVCANLDLNTTTEEVDMEIYEFEHEGHVFLIFEEEGKTVSVIHDPNCKCVTIK